jgi:hypothetical protein
MTIASNYGRREYLKLAVSHGAPMDVNVMKHCARYNDVDLIRELHSRGCKWFGLRCLIILDFFTCFVAIKYLHLGFRSMELFRGEECGITRKFRGTEVPC